LNPKKKIFLTAGISLLYIIINTLLIANEFYWFNLLPMALLLGAAFIYSLDKVYILVAFLTPMSIDTSNFGWSLGLSVPAEPIMAALLIIFLLKLFHDTNFDRSIFTHPVSYALYFYFVWMFITVFTSSDIVVSIKWFVAKMWLIIPTYFFGIMVFKEIKNIPRFVWAYTLGFIPVIFFTISVHAANGFSDHAAHWAMSPFYNDHTSYGAMLAMMIPVIMGFFLEKQTQSKNIRIFTFIALVILFIAIFFSISRAAWASLVGALIVFVMIKFRIRLAWVLTAAIAVLVLFFTFQDQILMKLEKNKQDSSKDFVKHVQSMSNITTDASNLERINRWKSAIRLFEDRPVFGWGPGTYQFVYAPYQKVEDKTVISTNVGNKGTAHSEYLLILSEQGALGLLSLLAIFILVASTAIRTYYKTNDEKAKRLVLLLFLGLITYLAHAFLNNFLDTDKAAVPFWGFIAGIVAIDLYHKESKKIDN
jgi:O-antigen ligase